ncbi:MAG: hypothetical protein ACI9L9_000812, partial [Marivirga sp.]
SIAEDTKFGRSGFSGMNCIDHSKQSLPSF